MPHRHPSLSEIDDCLAKRRTGWRFPAAIEAAFEQHTRHYRARAMRSTIVPSVIVYNLFLAVDWLLMPETFWLAAALHLALVTPLILCAGALVVREPGLLIRETTAASLPFLMVAQIMTVYALSPNPAADHYQYLAIMIVVYMNVNQRLDSRFALGASAVLAALYLSVLLAGHSPFAVKLIGASSMLAVAYVTLMANRRMERDARYAFLRRLQDQLQREEARAAAGRDPLTGLANRRHLDERMTQIWADADATTSSAAVLIIDVDHFKAYNDRYGHPAGDLCLKRVAGAISRELRGEADLAARFGGEEFLVLLPRTDLAEAVRVAERIRRAIEALAIPHEAFGASGFVTASLGVLSGSVSAHDASELIAGADTALYAAKRSGRNQVWPPLVAVGGAVTALRARA